MHAVPAPARRRLGVDLAILGVVGVLLVAALGAAGMALYREVYSRFALDDAPSDALLRQAALGPLTDIEILSEEQSDAGTAVTAGYLAGGHPGASTFLVEQDGWNGVVPRWRFAQSPLAVIDIVVLGSDEVIVNDFRFDRRQVAADGVESDPLEPVPLLVFTPGLYSVSVDTAVSATPGIRFLADSPAAVTPLDVQTKPTEELLRVVQEQVDDYLRACAAQRVLLPTGCPFGFEVTDRIDDEPEWSIAQSPAVTVMPDGAHWRIPATQAVAHIDVEVRSIFDGRLRHVSEDVSFMIDGTVTMRADGTLSILIGSPGQD